MSASTKMFDSRAGSRSTRGGKELPIKAFILGTAAACGAFMQNVQFCALWNDPAVARRIDAGIETNRLGRATIQFVDAPSKKAAQHTLRKLIQENLRTRLEGDSGTSADVRFQGFYGTYSANVVHEGKRRISEFDVVKGTLNVIEVRL